MSRASRGLLAAGFGAAGALHFARPRMYEAIMPSYLPAHRELVLASGAAEIIGAAALLVPRWRAFARWWLVLLLVAVFPANVHMTLEHQDYPKVPAWALWLRLPLQGVLAAWVWRATADRGRASPGS